MASHIVNTLTGIDLDAKLAGKMTATELKVTRNEAPAWAYSNVTFEFDMAEVTVRELAELAIKTLVIRGQRECKEHDKAWFEVANNRKFSVRAWLDVEKATPVILGAARVDDINESTRQAMIAAGLSEEQASQIIAAQAAKMVNKSK